MHPAALYTGFAKHLRQRLPEPNAREAAAFQIQQYFFPRLLGFPKSVHQNDQFLLALSRGAYDHQDALVCRFQPHTKMDAIHPPIHILLVA